MENKILPIGSVCTLKGKNKKIMITGYYSTSYNGNFKINDYCGYTYPEGMLVPNSFYSFDEEEIETVDFYGFENDDQKKFNQLICRLMGKNDDSNIENSDWILTSGDTYSKILFDENGVVVLAESLENDDSISNPDNDFEGILENPFYKSYDKLENEQDSKTNIDDNFKFNENGYAVEEKFEQEKQGRLSAIEFDENGYVIEKNVLEEDLNKQAEKESRYNFDENGILIAVDEAAMEEEIPPIGPGLPGYVEPKNKKTSNYSFDENGNLVSSDEISLEQEEEVPPIGPGLPGYVEPKKESKYKFDEEGNVISE